MSGKPIRILLVEDNPGDARLLQEALAEAGSSQFEMEHVGRLSEAQRRLGEKQFDVVLLDLSLPDGQGLDTVVSVRERAPALPIVILTGLVDEEMALKAVRAGAQDYLIKGQVDGNLLSRAMRYSIERKRVEEKLQSRCKELETLHEMGQMILSSPDLKTVLEKILDQALLLGSFDTGVIRLFNPSGQILEPVVLRGFQDPKGVRAHQVGDPTAGKIMSQVMDWKETGVLENVSDCDGMRTLKREGVRSAILLPVRATEGVLLGVMQFGSRTPRSFKPEEIQSLEAIGHQMGIAVQKARLYEEIKASMVELEKALQVKSDFLGTMSHELRTPLHVIMSNVALLIDGLCGEINEEQGKRLKVIERNSEDLLRLVQGVLDITRIEEGRMPLQLEEIHMGEILNEVQGEFHDLSLKKGITLEVDNNGSTPPMVSDRLKLKEILHNLISNAMKFTKDGKVEVRGRHLKDKDQIELLVQDSGIGIPEEDLPHIFDVFYQVDSSNQREFGGTGLGLNIVKRLVELLQGEIRVESEFGKGSTFYVTLPRKVSVSEPS